VPTDLARCRIRHWLEPDHDVEYPRKPVLRGHLQRNWNCGRVCVLYPFCGSLLSPVIAGPAISLNSVSVIGNALRLTTAKL
jgi:hypothetical protein